MQAQKARTALFKLSGYHDSDALQKDMSGLSGVHRSVVFLLVVEEEGPQHEQASMLD